MNNIIFNETSLETSLIPNEKISPFVHENATIRNSQITGNVIVEENVHIVNAVIRADEGTPFFIGQGSNIQDFATLHGYTTQENGQLTENNLVYVEEKGYFSIYIDEFVSISHGVLVHGPSYIGKNTFVGFKSTIDAAHVGSNVEIGAHSYIKNVKIPDNIAILPNSVITKQEDVDKYSCALSKINNKIVKVNIELAKAYKKQA